MAVIPAIALGFLILLLAGGVVVATSRGDELAGHPKGLYVLFFAEMWERFSYYGMRALLVFYLTKHWLFSDGQANLIYGAYTSLVYVTPVLGGYLADRYLGQRKAVVFGAVLLSIGHLLMAVEGDGGQRSAAIDVFWLALAFIIVGVGFLKANISVIVGQLYPRTDVRRDGAYTIFYVGINVGSAVGTIIAGWLGETYGWSYGFGAAGVGMLLGLFVFVIGRPLLLGRGEAPDPAALLRKVMGLRLEWLLYAAGTASIAVIWALIQYQAVIQNLLIVAGVALLGYVLYAALKLDRHARDRIFAILFLIALNPLFWGLYEQAGGSLNLYTDRYVDRAGVPASLFQSVNPIYIVLMGPIFAALWVMLGKRGREPSAPAKFGIGLLLVGLSFLVFVGGAHSVGAAVATPVVFVFAIYFLQTAGELCLSPVGLSAMNRLAPQHLASLMMGAWFYMTAVGNFVAGKIGEATGGESGEMTKEATLSIYAAIGWWAIGIGAAVVAVSPLVKRLMHLDTLADDADHAMAGEGQLGEPAAAGGPHDRGGQGSDMIGCGGIAWGTLPDWIAAGAATFGVIAGIRQLTAIRRQNHQAVQFERGKLLLELDRDFEGEAIMASRQKLLALRNRFEEEAASSERPLSAEEQVEVVATKISAYATDLWRKSRTYDGDPAADKDSSAQEYLLLMRLAGWCETLGHQCRRNLLPRDDVLDLYDQFIINTIGNLRKHIQLRAEHGPKPSARYLENAVWLYEEATKYSRERSAPPPTARQPAQIEWH